jgi:hypothetical protein
VLGQTVKQEIIYISRRSEKGPQHEGINRDPLFLEIKKSVWLLGIHNNDNNNNTGRQKCCATGSRKEVKIQQFMYRDTTNVEPEMYGYTGNNWSHWNTNKKLKETFGSCTGKTFDRFTTKDSYTWNNHT